MQIEEKTILEVIPGMITAEDIVIDDVLIVDQMSILSTLVIQELKAKNFGNVKIVIPDEFIDDRPPDPKFDAKRKAETFDNLFNDVMLYEPGVDNELEIKKKVKKITKSKDPIALEALEYILLFFPDAQGREFAVEGLNNFGTLDETLRYIYIAIRDENQKVRRGAFSLLTKYKGQDDIVLESTQYLDKTKLVDEVYTDMLNWYLKTPGLADTVMRLAENENNRETYLHLPEIAEYVEANKT